MIPWSANPQPVTVPIIRAITPNDFHLGPRSAYESFRQKLSTRTKLSTPGFKMPSARDSCERARAVKTHTEPHFDVGLDWPSCTCAIAPSVPITDQRRTRCIQAEIVESPAVMREARRLRHCQDCQASRAVFRKLASDNVGPQRRSLLCVVWLGVRRDFSDEGLAAPPLGRTGHPFEEIALSILTRSRWLWRNGPSLETRRRLGQHPPLSHHGCQQALERGP